jgi:hypothetical protein
MENTFDSIIVKKKDYLFLLFSIIQIYYKLVT